MKITSPSMILRRRRDVSTRSKWLELASHLAQQGHMKNTRKTFIAAALMLGFVLSATALAASQSGTVSVPAGQRRCIDLATTANRSVVVNDFVNSGHKVKFLLLGKKSGSSTYEELATSGESPVSSFAATLTPQTHPAAFPGVFRTCARNFSDKPSVVTLNLRVDE
jgi:hypothetical protein